MLGVFAKLQQKAEAAGRDKIPITMYGIPRDPARVVRYAEEGGVHRLVFWIPSKPRDEVEPMLDERATLVEQLLGSAPA
jgi:hypothetical protein